MKISIIVATLGRPDHIKVLLESLKRNSRLPNEVIIVEQGDVEALKAVTDNYVDFPINIIFQEERSLAAARQTGVNHSTGEVLILCDDDIEFNEQYIETVATYFESHPKILGLTGSYMHKSPAWTWKRFVGLLFWMYSFKKSNIVLRSGAYDYVRGNNLTQEHDIQWLYGCNMCLRKRVFDEGFKFNDKFLRWSFGEDVMFSYSIYKKYPGSLKYLPGLAIKHNEGTSNKMLNEQVLRMKIIYRYIFWRKEVYRKGTLDVVAYIWSQAGQAGLDLLKHPSWRTFLVLLASYRYLLLNKVAIRDDKVDYNAFIFS